MNKFCVKALALSLLLLVIAGSNGFAQEVEDSMEEDSAPTTAAPVDIESGEEVPPANEEEAYDFSEEDY